MTRRLSRAHALLSAALLLFGSFRGVLGPSVCAQHDKPAQHASHAAPAHAAHGSHQAAPADQKAPDDHSACTCLDHCSACQVFAPGGAAAPLAFGSFVLTGRTSAPPAHVPARVAHQLPFANAPPAIA